jgi:hypothetical protein
VVLIGECPGVVAGRAGSHFIPPGPHDQVRHRFGLGNPGVDWTIIAGNIPLSSGWNSYPHRGSITGI